MTARRICFLFIFVISAGAPAHAGKLGITDRLNGTYVVSFRTAEGEVKVFLPDDTAGGDTVSASLFAYPAGATEAAKSKNLSLLNSYTVHAGGQNAHVRDRGMTINIPRNMSGSSLRITLRGPSNRELSRASVLVKLPGSYAERPGVPTPFDFECPLIGQAGRLVEIIGPFDGDFATTELKIGGKRAYMLAESPRKLVFEAPPDVSGSTELVLNENGVVVKRPFTCLRVVKIGEEASSPAARVTPEGFSAQEGFGALQPKAGTAPDAERSIGFKEQTVTTEPPSRESLIVEEEPGLESVGVEEKETPLDSEIKSNNGGGNTEIGLLLAKQLNVSLEGVSLVIKEEEIDTVMVVGIKNPGDAGRTGPLSVRSEDEIIEKDILVAEKSNVPETTRDSGAQESGYSSKELIERIYESTRRDWDKPAPETAGRSGGAGTVESKESLSEGNLAVRPGDESPYAAKGKYTVQVAAFRDTIAARSFAEELRRKGYRVTVAEADVPGKGRWSRVRVGAFLTKQEAREYGNKLKMEEPGVKSVFITHID